MVEKVKDQQRGGSAYKHDAGQTRISIKHQVTIPSSPPPERRYARVMGPVCAVVVTYNRKEMLRRCLSALSEQRRAPDRILVVDNASSDGTREMLAQEFASTELLAMAVNEGGAGGFHEGMKRAHADGAEWLWLMDDDTIPEPDALAELLHARERLDHESAPTLLASRAIWRDGTMHPMNMPIFERRRMERVIAAVQQGVMPIRGATFVSLLVHRGVVDRYELPLKHFFLWADDIEYTSRVVLGGDGAYFVPTSVVLHDTAAAEDFRTAKPDRFYYHVRNTLFMARAGDRPARDRLLRLWILVSTCVDYVLRNRSAASVAAIARALRDGLRRVPAQRS